MSLRDLGDRIKQSLGAGSSPTAEQVEQSATTTRQDRAGSISQLHVDVSRIQHQIADLSANSEGEATDLDTTATAKQIDALQKELEQTQQSLAKLQGRV